MNFRLTRTVKILLIANLTAFIVQQTADRFFGTHFVQWLGLVPYQFVFKFHFWQIFTYAFLHADVMHLFLNLLMLVFIGSELEATWGWKRFTRFYVFCGVVAGICYLAIQTLVTGGLAVPMIGASGSIYGLLMAYGLLFGERTLLFMMLFPMKAKHFVWVLAGIEFMTSLFSPHGGLSSVAHLGGMAAGFGYLWGWAYFRSRAALRDVTRRGKRRKGRPKGGKNPDLRLVINNEFDDDDPPKTWH